MSVSIYSYLNKNCPLYHKNKQKQKNVINTFKLLWYSGSWLILTRLFIQRVVNSRTAKIRSVQLPNKSLIAICEPTQQVNWKEIVCSQNVHIAFVSKNGWIFSWFKIVRNDMFMKFSGVKRMILCWMYSEINISGSQSKYTLVCTDTWTCSLLKHSYKVKICRPLCMYVFI